MESTTTNAFRGHCALQLVDAVNNVKHALEDSKKKKKKAFTRNVTLQLLPLVLFVTSVSCNFVFVFPYCISQTSFVISFWTDTVN